MRQYSLPNITNLNNDIVRFPYLNSQRQLLPLAPMIKPPLPTH